MLKSQQHEAAVSLANIVIGRLAKSSLSYRLALAEARAWKAWALAVAGRTEEAASEIGGVLAGNDSNAFFHFLACKVYLRGGDETRAIQELRAAVEKRGGRAYERAAKEDSSVAFLLPRISNAIAETERARETTQGSEAAAGNKKDENKTKEQGNSDGPCIGPTSCGEFGGRKEGEG
jgi:hypothetical protein